VISITNLKKTHAQLDTQERGSCQTQLGAPSRAYHKQRRWQRRLTSKPGVPNLGYIHLSEGVHLLHNRNKLTSRRTNAVYLHSSENLNVWL